MKSPVIIVFGLIILFNTCGSFIKKGSNEENDDQSNYKVMFYNVENLFDVKDDSLTNDDEYTPAGSMHWTNGRYYKKLHNIEKVVIAVGGWKPVDIIGLCEIENYKVLSDLINNTSLSKYQYGIIHKDSPDKRGIDVALLYNKKTVRYLMSRNIRLTKKGLATRDILYTKMLINRDTCHFFLNHWPSRSPGQIESEKDRIFAAKTLRHYADSLFMLNEKIKIIIMGDFNDEPSDKSIRDILQASSANSISGFGNLYNLITEAPVNSFVGGTLKYKGEWNTFDQLIVSGGMLKEPASLTIKANSINILKNTFLLEIDEMYNGYKPLRTYSGFKYVGGFSDHLPVYMELNPGKTK